MNTDIEQFKQQPDFLIKSSQGITTTALFLLAPFSINNFFQGRHLLGAGILAILILCAINAWHCKRGNYYFSINFLAITPSIIFFLMLVFREQGLLGVFWTYLAVLSFYFILPQKLAWIANAVLLCLILPQAWNILGSPVTVRFVVTLLGTCIFSSIFVRVITEQQYKLEELASIDSLTGLFNRTQLQNKLEQAINHSHRMNSPMALMMIDMDHFKSINDSLGHEAGDLVLRDMGTFLQQYFRNTDTVFRIGGEEFLVLLYNTDEDFSLKLAEQLLSEVNLLPLLPKRSVTVSIGLADLRPENDWKEWMKRSDDNLYLAKLNGRNQVVS